VIIKDYIFLVKLQRNGIFSNASYKNYVEKIELTELYILAVFGRFQGISKFADLVSLG